MSFFEEECSAGRAWDLALVCARDDHDDDESSFFRLGATLFESRRGSYDVRGRGARVAFCLRISLYRFCRGLISADRNRNHPLNGMFMRPFIFETSSENYRILVRPQPFLFLWEERTLVIHHPTGASPVCPLLELMRFVAFSAQHRDYESRDTYIWINYAPNSWARCSNTVAILVHILKTCFRGNITALFHFRTLFHIWTAAPKYNSRVYSGSVFSGNAYWFRCVRFN